MDNNIASAVLPLSEASPKAWAYLADAENAAGIPFSNVQFRYERRGVVRVVAQLDAGDDLESASKIAGAIGRVHQVFDGEFEVSKPYECSAQPTGMQVGVRVHFERLGIQFTVKSLLDASLYAATEEPGPAEVAA